MELKDQIKIILYKKTVQIKEENMSKSKVHMPKELEKNVILPYMQQRRLQQRQVQFRYQWLMQYQ